MHTTCIHEATSFTFFEPSDSYDNRWASCIERIGADPFYIWQ